MEMDHITNDLVRAVRRLRFAPPITHVYNPLEYARPAYDLYLRRYGQRPREVILVGMNPGPWGMVQTGIPFGDVRAVKEWLRIEAPVGRPSCLHPKRPVYGFSCTRREVSGQRLWGWAQRRFKTPRIFFARFFVANYCPLAFFEETGRNRTPDSLRAGERKPLLEACDLALRRTIEWFRPRLVVGVGGFAAERVQTALSGLDVTVGRITHPSPANPKANRGWEDLVRKELAGLGIEA